MLKLCLCVCETKNEVEPLNVNPDDFPFNSEIILINLAGNHWYEWNFN